MLKIQYLVLLRGINVGGNNIIKMMDLKRCFEDLGFGNVATYIQSGNVLFYSDEEDKTKLINFIEQALSKRFSYDSRIVIITDQQLGKIVEEAPSEFGKESNKYRFSS